MAGRGVSRVIGDIVRPIADVDHTLPSLADPDRRIRRRRASGLGRRARTTVAGP